MKITVINKHHYPKDHLWKVNQVNVMRPTPLGNPYPITLDSQREEVIAKYDIWLEDQLRAGDDKIITSLEYIAGLAQSEEGVELVCCCAPQACHGNVIKRYVENALQGRDPWAHPPSLISATRTFKRRPKRI